MHILRLIRVAALVFYLASLSLAGSNIAAVADAVVVGEVTAGEQTGSQASFTLRVDRSLKGTLASGTLVNAAWAEARPVVGTLKLSGAYGIWFLRALPSGPWQLLPANSSNAGVPVGLACYPIPKTSIPPDSAAPGSSTTDLVATELSYAIESLPKKTLAFYYSATALLGMSSSPAVTAQYERLSNSADAQIRVVGFTGLVESSDVTALEYLQQLQDALRTSEVGVQMISAVRRVRDTSPRVVSALGKLTATPNAAIGVDLAAADALRAIHTKETLPLLVALLDSADPRICHQALAGLSMFVENLPVQMPEMIPKMTWMNPQGPALYRTAETDKYSATYGGDAGRQAEYAAFWKSWWARMQNQIK